MTMLGFPNTSNRCFTTPRSSIVRIAFVVLLLLLVGQFSHSVSQEPEDSRQQQRRRRQDKKKKEDDDEMKNARKGGDMAAESRSTMTMTSPSTIKSTKSTRRNHHARPTNVLQAEARTARELSRAVQSLQTDVETCQTRVDAIQTGFQNLYSAHLANVDGLRKCREGVLGPAEFETLSATSRNLMGKVDEALLHEAHAKEEERLRREQQEELANKHRELISSLEHQVQSLILREKAWERTISELVARRDLLEQREGAWERTIAELMAEVEVRVKRESWYEDMKDEMEGRISLLSRNNILEKFGPGPHYISMIVDIDEDHDQSTTDEPRSTHHEIILELAPIDLMPHSIHLFLAQVSEGYWSRGSPAIIINAGHVLQACPHPCLESFATLGPRTVMPHDNHNWETAFDPYIDMKNAGLDSVSFQEYHPLYPHEKYTVGFAGRPHSGPEFYINLLNNTLDHGPLEQRERELGPNVDRTMDHDNEDEKVVEPDPCFGKVVEGFHVIDRIAGMLTRGELPREVKENYENMDEAIDNTLLVRPIRIVSMTILEEEEEEESQDGSGEQYEYGSEDDDLLRDNNEDESFTEDIDIMEGDTPPTQEMATNLDRKDEL